MDIKQKALTDLAFIHLKDGDDNLMYDGDPKEGRKVGAWVYGPGSRQFVAAQTRANNRSIDLIKKKGKADQSPDESLAADADFLASITDRFENLSYDGLSGHALSMAVFSDPSLVFIGKQIKDFSAETSNFTKGSATT